MLLRGSEEKTIIGLIHLLPMPNTPYHQAGDFERSMEKALLDAKALLDGGASGCLLQTVDRVYPAGDDTDYIRVSCMTLIAHEVRRLTGPDFLIGVQLMWNCITPSLAAAKAAGADFVRCSALVGSTASPFGAIAADPLKVMNYRKQIDGEKVSLLAEVSGYHFHVQGGCDTQSLQDTAFNASMVGCDGLEVFHRDEAVNEQLVIVLKQAAPRLPVILGGGTTVENCARRLKYADGALVGSCFEGGKWGGGIDSSIVSAYMRGLKGNG